jgi:hypothetical protein
MDTRKAKLMTGLLAAGAVAGGFGSAVLPAGATPRTVEVTLLGGQVVTLTIDVPPGTPLDQIQIPGIKLPIVSIKVLGEPEPAPAPAPAPAAPQPTATEPAPTTEAPAPAGGAQRRKADAEREGAVKRQRRARTQAGAPAQVVTGSAPQADAAPGAPVRTPGRDAGGAPTPANPSFSLALPGPAPVGVPNFFIDKFRIPPFLLPIYQAAGIQYGVRWEVLAAINEIETDYGRNLNVSSAGALGWMQFMPATWRQYGTDANGDGKKDPYNPVDAIFAAARYLKAAGAERDLAKAVFAYNHADWYVDSVLLRARLIGGLPADLVGSLSGLTQGHFPVFARSTYADDLSEKQLARRIARGRNAAIPVDSDEDRRGIDIFAKAGSPAVAVQDGRVVATGVSKRLGRFVALRDVYGNTYTYGHLKTVARAYPVPKPKRISRAEVRDELDLGGKGDAAPTRAASAGRQPADRPAREQQRVDRVVEQVQAAKERVFANPARERAQANGGAEQVLNTDLLSGSTSFKRYFTQAYGLQADDVEIRRLRVGSKVVAGTILGRLGRTDRGSAPHLRFEIRPAGRGAPRIDPKPILDGWKLLESTAIYRAQGRNPLFGPDAKGASIGQILLMGKEQLQRRVLTNPRIETYECGRRDIRAGIIDRRVLAAMEFLAASGLKPTVTSLRCGHSYLSASGNVSHHSSGNAFDIAKVNGVPILGNQGPGSVTDATIRRLLTLQGTLKPAQIISLMTFDGADNTLSLPDHADHIHVGFAPMYGTKGARRLDAVLKPTQWIKLIDRLGQIDNPDVPTSPSKYALSVKRRASDAHRGE